MGESLSDIGEFAAIERLTARIAPGSRVTLGPGDDCAVVENPGGRALLATADLLIEGRHFDLAYSSPADVGYKAIAVNVSDIAAMGGTPRFALVSLGAHASTGIEVLEHLYDGMSEASDGFGVAIAGGDTVASDPLVISVAMVGEAPDEGAVRRDGARAGDVLAVTGSLGAAAAGLALLRIADHDVGARELLARFPNLAEAHRRGRARVREGRAAARTGAHAMIDISDGLAQDAGHIVERSRLGRLDFDRAAIPLADGVREAAGFLGVEPIDLALSGGDDYELAIALDEADVAALRAAMSPTPLTVCGTFGAEGIEAQPSGFDHFRDA